MKIVTMKHIAGASMLCLLALSAATAMAQDASPSVNVGGQQLEGAWIITLASDPASASDPVAPPQVTSGILARDGTVLIHNTVPDKNAPCPCHTVDGVGEWVRVGNRQFALTWKYVITSATDGTFVGMFQDSAILSFSDDLTQLSGDFTFAVTLGASTTPIFSGKGKVTATRIQVVPLSN